MTKEEKIQQYLDSKSREDKLRDMRDSMWDWDTDSLIETAFGHIEENLETLNNKDFDDEYYEWFAYKFECNSDFDDDEELEPKVLDKCECDINQIARGDGHNDNCPDRHGESR
ncbi:MAG: hypothetical protein ACXAC5_04140 [Promethearchaeota archaeon]|jgi:hypothetical protein